MKPKSLAIGAVCAVALIAVGLGVQELRQPPRAASQSGERLYPQLIDDINEVTAMAVTTPEGSYRISRKDGTWGLEEKGGYPVDAGQVSKALIAIAELEKVEPKTSDPERYADIGVQDVDAEGAESKLVTLEGESGKVLASLIVGERRAGGRGASSLYVRKTGDAGSWLVAGTLDLREEGTGWLDKKIVELKRTDVQAVETTHPDGESVFVAKPDRGATDFEVHGVPEGRELKYATVANGIGGALEYLNLQDVVPATGFEAPEEEPVRTSFWTFDGMRVDVTMHEKDGKAYAAFRASYDAEGPPRLAAAVGPTPPPEDEDATEEGGEGAETEGEETEGEDTEGEEPALEVKRPETEVRQEAEALDARLSPWVFEIPAYNKTNLAKRMDDLLAEPPAEEEEGGAGDAVEPPTEGGASPAPVVPPEDAGADDDREARRADLEEKMAEFLREQQGAEPAAGDDPAEPTPADEPSPAEPPADEPPADEPPADEPPADQPPTDDPPGDDPPGDGGR